MRSTSTRTRCSRTAGPTTPGVPVGQETTCIRCRLRPTMGMPPTLSTPFCRCQGWLGHVPGSKRGSRGNCPNVVLGADCSRVYTAICSKLSYKRGFPSLKSGTEASEVSCTNKQLSGLPRMREVGAGPVAGRSCWVWNTRGVPGANQFHMPSWRRAKRVCWLASVAAHRLLFSRPSFTMQQRPRRIS